MAQKYRGGFAVNVLLPVGWIVEGAHSRGLARAALYESGGSDRSNDMRRVEAGCGRCRVLRSGFWSSEGEGGDGGSGVSCMGGGTGSVRVCGCDFPGEGFVPSVTGGDDVDVCTAS